MAIGLRAFGAGIAFALLVACNDSISLIHPTRKEAREHENNQVIIDGIVTLEKPSGYYKIGELLLITPEGLDIDKGIALHPCRITGIPKNQSLHVESIERLEQAVAHEAIKETKDRRPIGYFLAFYNTPEDLKGAIMGWRLGPYTDHEANDSQCSYEDSFLFGLMGKLATLPQCETILIDLWKNEALHWDGGPGEYLDTLIVKQGGKTLKLLEDFQRSNPEEAEQKGAQRLIDAVRRGYLDDFTPSPTTP